MGTGQAKYSKKKESGLTELKNLQIGDCLSPTNS
jgi:hypothetical protein